MNWNHVMSLVCGVECMVASIVYALIGIPMWLAGLFAMVGFWMLGLSVGMSLAGRGGDR